MSVTMALSHSFSVPAFVGIPLFSFPLFAIFFPPSFPEVAYDGCIIYGDLYGKVFGFPILVILRMVLIDVYAQWGKNAVEQVVEFLHPSEGSFCPAGIRDINRLGTGQSWTTEGAFLRLLRISQISLQGVLPKASVISEGWTWEKHLMVRALSGSPEVVFSPPTRVWNRIRILMSYSGTLIQSSLICSSSLLVCTAIHRHRLGLP